MGLIGREIIQSVKYEDYSVKQPNLNYSETFPITVFDAVRESIDDPSSITLSEILADIQQSLKAKQPLLPGKSADYLMTFAGSPGSVGSIQISHSVPWDPDKQSQERIPTEKAVGELMRAIGLIDDEGKSLIDPKNRQVRWADVIGRPLIYDGIGNNEDGFMTQKAVTDAITDIKIKLKDLDIQVSQDTKYIELNKKLLNHIDDTFNPHKVTYKQIGAASADALDYHINDKNNPHEVTAEQIGLGNVDNTSDYEKPISNAVQGELNKIYARLGTLSGDVSELDYIVDADYNKATGILSFTFASGKEDTVEIPTEGLIDEITFDSENKNLIVYELGGNKKEISLKSLTTTYEGSTGSIVNIDVDKDNNIIKASVNDNSIVSSKIRNEAITHSKLADNSVKTNNISDSAVTNEKLAKESVTTGKLGIRSVVGKNLFTSPNANRILGVTQASTDPEWIKLGTDFFDDNIITEDKIVNGAVTNKKLASNSVTNDKIADNAISSNNIINNSIDSNKIASSIKLKGTPKLDVRPAPSSKDDSIPDTYWVKNYVENKVFDEDNIVDRSITASKLFTSSEKDRVLGVRVSKSDPEWTQVTNGMLADNIVSTSKIQNKSVTTDKISDLAITSNKLSNDSVTTSKIKDKEVTFDKIEPADGPNYVISTNKYGTPRYTKVTSAMIEADAITNENLRDGNISTSKLISSDESYVVLGVKASNSVPQYTKVTSGMISDKSIYGRHLFRSSYDNKVLVSNVAGNEPFWGEITNEMIADKTISGSKIGSRTITGVNIKVGSITRDNLSDDFDFDIKWINNQSLPVNKLEPSPVSNKVLAVTAPYGDPIWTNVSTKMIEDGAVTSNKIFSSKKAHRVLAATSANAAPEYTLITGEYITDRSITSNELAPNLVFVGSPEITVHPVIDSNDYHIATTQWVNWKINEKLKDLADGDITINDGCNCDTIDDNRLEDLINDVLGNYNNDWSSGGNGNISCECDCDTITDERLEDLINDVLGNSQSGWIPPTGNVNCECEHDPITTERLDKLIDEAIGEFLGTDIVNGDFICGYAPPVTDERLDELITEVLGAYDGSFDWHPSNGTIVTDHSITGKQLFTTDGSYKVLVVKEPNSDAVWDNINGNYIEDNSITIDKLDKELISTIEKKTEISSQIIPSNSINSNHLSKDFRLDGELLLDESVDTDKLADDSVTSEKIEEDVVLRGAPTVEGNSNYMKKQLRNIIISDRAPTEDDVDFENGDIWFSYY